jgi:predicted Zn-dependent protease
MSVRHVIALGWLAAAVAAAPLAAAQTAAPARSPVFSGGASEPAPPPPAPELPELGEAASAELSPALEARIADEIARQIRRSADLIDDAELSNYLERLGQRLVAASPAPQQPFRFFLLKDDSINAAAFVGGVVIVHSGLILAAQSESELASVLAHEIAHVTQRHIARMIANQSQMSVPLLAALAVAILAARSSPDLASAAIATSQAAAVQTQLNFSRDAEREADRIGLQILEKAGFDPRGMPVFFERMQRASHLQETGAPVYLRSHPLTFERIADVDNRVQQLPYRQVRDPVEFHMAREKLRVLRGSPRDLLVDFDHRLEQGKFIDEQATRYGRALTLMRLGKLAEAENELSTLRTRFPAEPMVETMAGRLLWTQGRRDEALAHYRSAIDRFPAHRALAYEYAQALYDSGQVQASLEAARRASQAFPGDSRLQRLQAQAYAAQGKQLLSHQAQGEAYFLEWDLRAAVQQLELAAQAEGSFYEKSIVESRLRALRRELVAMEATRPR